MANVPQAQFERYFLNRWTRTEETWLPAGAWDACEVATFEFDPELPLYALSTQPRRRTRPRSSSPSGKATSFACERESGSGRRT